MQWLRSFIIAALVCTAPMASATWSISDLGTLHGGNTSFATDINNLGQVVGSAAVPTLVGGLDWFDFPNAFISAPNGGALTDLGQLSGRGSWAYAVNDEGRVVGMTTVGSSFPTGFLTGPNGAGGVYGTGFSLPPGAGFPSGSPADINNLGQVTGHIGDVTFVTGPNGEGAVAISTEQHPWGEPVAINDRGQVAMSGGYIWTQVGGIQAVGAGVGYATDINAAGQIVGTTLSGAGFISGPDGGALQLIGTLGGTSTNPLGLNDLGQIVGKSQTTDGQMHAFVTALDGALIDLELVPEIVAAGWSNLDVVAINNLGQIAGTGIIDGNQRAFFLAPPIPEPESMALLLAGLALLGVLRRRQGAG